MPTPSTPVPSASVPLPARYHATGFLAAGGMAGVWAAHDELLSRDVAIKVLAEHLSTSDDAKRRFQREARAAAGLSSHPHVVTIYDVGEHAGRAFIVMELMRGGTVADRLRTRQLTRDDALRWIAETGSALDAAHAAGFVHRDIKPGNLLLDEHGRLAVGDFGIVRLADAVGEDVTQTGVVLGTAAYLSPEQAAGEGATAASDRYALAVVAFELLTGMRPFRAEHFAAQARQHLDEQPPDACSLAPGLPPALDPVLQRGLAKDPHERWPSCAALVGALTGVLSGNAPSAPAWRRGAAGAVPSPAGAAPGAPGGSGPPEPARRAAAAPPARPHAPRGQQPPPALPTARVASPGGRAPTSPGGPGTGPSRPGRRGLLALAAALLAALAIGGLVLALSDGGEGGPASSSRRDSPPNADRLREDRGRDRGDDSADPEATASPEASATAEPSASASPSATPNDDGGDDDGARPGTRPRGGTDLNAASRDNARGYALWQQGSYEQAIAPLQRAVEACGSSSTLDPCGYAYFNLGSALHRADRSREAIPYLQTRLNRWSFKQGEVRRELRAARRSAS